MTRKPDSLTPGDWTVDAECAGVDMGLSTTAIRRGDGAQAQSLIARYCMRCQVLDECREWALTVPDPAYGHVAGGMTPKQRIARRRATT